MADDERKRIIQQHTHIVWHRHDTPFKFTPQIMREAKFFIDRSLWYLPLWNSLHGHAGVDAEFGLLLGRGRLNALSLAARLQEPESQAPGLVLCKKERGGTWVANRVPIRWVMRNAPNCHNIRWKRFQIRYYVVLVYKQGVHKIFGPKKIGKEKEKLLK